MKYLFQLFENLVAGSLGKILLISNFIVCFVIFSCGQSLRIIEKSSSQISSGAISFCSYNYSLSPFDLILIYLNVLYYIFFYPSITITEQIINLVESFYPSWYWASINIFFMPIFTLINAFYWLFLGDMIELLYSFKPKPQKPLSILAD